jgi:hypothetical protein
MPLPSSTICRTQRDRSSNSKAQVLLQRHSECRWRTAAGASLAVIAVAGGAAAAEPAPAPASSVSYFGELRAIGGGATVGWTNTDVPVVDQEAAVIGLGLRAGLALGPHLHLGLTGSMTRYSRVGELEVRDAELFGDELWLRETSYTLWAPLGLFVEVYLRSCRFPGLDPRELQSPTEHER